MSHFRVEGGFLTGIARDRVVEGRFDHGYEILHEGLAGISSDQVLSILRGDHKLVGVNNLEMVDDGDDEWKSRLFWMFAGTWVTSGGRYMRPYAVVTSWGSDDMRRSKDITKDSDSVRDRRGEQCAGSSLFYANDPERDVLKVLRFDPSNPYIDRRPDGKCHILFEEIRNYPFQLVPAHNDAQKALDQYLEIGRGLQEVGYAVSFPSDLFKVRYETANPTDPRPAVASHLKPNTADAQLSALEIGRHRSKMIDVEKFGGTVEEFENFQRIMINDSNAMADRMEAYHRAIELQGTVKDAIPLWREQIKQQAGDAWLDLALHDGSTIKLPRAPFENWCLWRTDGAHLAMPWTRVSPPGVKMFGDDPYHTDFLVGAGLEPDAMSADPELNDAVYRLRGWVQKEKLGFTCAVLSGKGRVRGTVVHPKPGDKLPDDAVVVLRDASPRYLDLTLKAVAVIVERGGSMAHLVSVAREREAVIARVDNALKLYPPGSSVTIDADAGKIELHEGNMKSIWEMFDRVGGKS